MQPGRSPTLGKAHAATLNHVGRKPLVVLLAVLVAVTVAVAMAAASSRGGGRDTGTTPTRPEVSGVLPGDDDAEVMRLLQHDKRMRSHR